PVWPTRRCLAPEDEQVHVAVILALRGDACAIRPIITAVFYWFLFIRSIAGRVAWRATTAIPRAHCPAPSIVERSRRSRGATASAMLSTREAGGRIVWR